MSEIVFLYLTHHDPELLRRFALYVKGGCSYSPVKGPGE